MSEKKLYIYEGPVMQFNNVIQDLWIRGTQAISGKRALANLQFTYKKRKKLSSNVKIILDEKYLRIEEGYLCKN